MKLKLLIFFLCFSLITFAQNPNDCTNAITICGDSSLDLEPDGIGLDEFSLPGNTAPPCYSFDTNTIWFRFDFIQDGVFTFDLEPETDITDYDFAIYGPITDCSNLGQSIRCSSTNPEAANVPGNTGLNLTETDTEEGPGEDGNGYLMFIDVLAGETYYLLIDRAEGSGPFSIFYTGTAALPETVSANPVSNLFACDRDGNQDGFTSFNLELQTPIIIGNQSNANVTYHLNANDAGIGQNSLTSPYTNIENPQTIHARIENNNNCFDITTFTLEAGDITVNPPEDVILCNPDNNFLFLLSQLESDIVSDPSQFFFSYHLSLNDAENNANPIGQTILLTTTQQTIYVRVENRSNSACFDIISFEAYLNPSPIATKPTDIIDCEVGTTGQITVDLYTKNDEILNGLDPNRYEVFYYTSISDRRNGGNEIVTPLLITQSPQTIYVSLYDRLVDCYGYTNFNVIVLDSPEPTFEEDPYYYCINVSIPITISVESGFNYYVWNTGEEGSNLNTITINDIGTYSVTVTNEFGCEGTESVEVIASDIATITDVIVTDFNGENNQIEILIEGVGAFEYALDNNFIYQDSNIFTGLENGYHTIYVRNKYGCGVVSQEVLVLDYPRFFTPNQDGYHDTWKIIGIEDFPGTEIKIYDRFGKLLKRINPDSKGWDGSNLEGVQLASNDYWFTIDIKDRPQYRGHFTLKR